MSHLFDQDLRAFRESLRAVHDEAALYQVQVAYLGKKGVLAEHRGRMGALAPEERRAFGQAFNDAKAVIERELAERRAVLSTCARDADLRRFEDLTLVRPGAPPGAVHIVRQTRRRIEAVFRGLGYETMDGPHVESERYNFDDLNIPSDHPARDMQDTFFVRQRGPGSSPTGLVLRTHTSPVQIRTMLGRRPPVRIIAPGAVFRRDDDATHTPMFHQVEGLCVDRGISMAHLKSTLYRFVGAFFEDRLEIRFRPSYFPFVEPGAEFDMQCPFCRGGGCTTCKGSSFIELGGAGMVHPAVFEAVGYDPEVYTGWAFGFGIDRMAMLYHGVRDLRLLFEGDIRFSEQFPC